MSPPPRQEGSLDAPMRHPVDWRDPAYYDEQALNRELERVFDICHGCRRCVNLCGAFPTLFDLVDESETMEVDGVAAEDYVKVVDHCYLCDLCFMTKCPYVPPHEWNVDFPHLMLRAKAVKFRNGRAPRRDRMMTSTDALGKLASIPVVHRAVNAAVDSKAVRKRLDKTLGISAQARLPHYQPRPLHKRLARREAPVTLPAPAAGGAGKVALFVTCYDNYNEPGPVEDLIAVFGHNGIACEVVQSTRCCGMPKLELGDLEAVREMKEANAPLLAGYAARGFDIIAAVPSCLLMFRQELPLLFAGDADVEALSGRLFDPCEYLWLRHKGGALNLEFRNRLGDVLHHAACHQRVQNIGPKTRDLLSLVPGTTVESVERCSGHDGVYAMRSESRRMSVKIAKPVMHKLNARKPDYFTSDCMLAGHHIADLADGEMRARHPLSLLRLAYGI